MPAPAGHSPPRSPRSTRSVPPPHPYTAAFLYNKGHRQPGIPPAAHTPIWPAIYIAVDTRAGVDRTGPAQYHLYKEKSGNCRPCRAGRAAAMRIAPIPPRPPLPRLLFWAGLTGSARRFFMREDGYLKAKKRHYAWMVLACCILISVSHSIITCAAGNFVTPIVQDLGCKVSAFTMIVSIEAFTMALLYPIAGKVLTTGKIGLVITLALLLQYLGMFLMGTYRSIYGFYLSGVMIGVGSAFSVLVALPIIINMWFKKKTGMALGIATSFGSAGAIICNLLSAQLIAAFGWRNAYFILAVGGAVISVPFVCKFMKSPQEVGCAPYGADEPDTADDTSAHTESEWGLTRKQAFKKPLFYLAWLTCLCYSIGTGVPGYVATFTTMELGKSLQFGSIAATCVSVGTVLCGFLLGSVNDRFGVKAGMLWGVVFMGSGLGGMILAISNSAFLLPACLLMGLGGSMYTVQAPLVARHAVGGKHYSDIWAIMMIGNSMIGAFSYAPIGLFYDKTGTYKGAFILGIAMFALALILGSVAIDMSKKERRAYTARQKTGQPQ